MKTRLHIQQKIPSQSTHTPISNPFQARSFDVNNNSHHNSSSQQNVDLEAQYEQAKRMGRNWADIPVYPPGKEPAPPIQAKLNIGQPGDKYEQKNAQVVSQTVQKINSSNNNIQKEEITTKSLIQKQDNSLLPTNNSTNQKSQDDSHHRIASDITGIFEGGKASSLQTVDAGIISYGKHQATLASGSLYSILKAYIDLSKTSTAINISEYLERVKKKDETLREDQTFLQLLKDAANEPEMAQAQEDIFSQKYWQPSTQVAEKAGVKSALGKAIFYDTKIQGGLDSVLKKTQEQLKDKNYTEQEFLTIFLQERSKRLYEIAKANRDKAAKELNQGNSQKSKSLQKNAQMLENSAVTRIGALNTLVDSGNLDLIGDEKGKINVGGKKVSGLGKGMTNTSANAATSTAVNIGNATIKVSALNVRQTPNTIGSKLGVLSQGEEVQVTKHIGDWLEINYQNKTAFISAKYADFIPSPVNPKTPNPQIPKQDTTQSQEKPSLVESLYDQGKEFVSEVYSSIYETGASLGNSVLDLFSNKEDQPQQTVNETNQPEKASENTHATELANSNNELDALMAKERLTPEEIKKARELIAKESDEKQRGDLYLALQEKVEYHSQRDNQTKENGKKIGDVMCNLTSLAMCLSYLGISNPNPEMQFEDALEKIRLDKKLPARTTSEGWGGVAKELGVTLEFLGWNIVDKKEWYQQNVLPRLRQGDAVMMSITGHIVRVQAVTDSGLIVDDPYGKVILKKGADHGWEFKNKSDKNGKTEKENAGEDAVWPWSEVAQHQMFWIAAFNF